MEPPPGNAGPSNNFGGNNATAAAAARSPLSMGTNNYGGVGNARLGPRGIKRNFSVIQDGIPETAEELVTDFLCPICMELIKEAHLISCGHTFCRACLEKSIETNKRCPTCNYTIYENDHIYPNHLVNKQVIKYRQSLELKKVIQRKSKTAALDSLKSYIGQEKSAIEICDITDMISLLQEKKEEMLSQADETKYKLLISFLVELKKKKEEQLTSVTQELNIINYDLEAVQNALEDMTYFASSKPSMDHREVPDNREIPASEMDVDNGPTAGPASSSVSSAPRAEVADDVSNIEGFNVPVDGDVPSKNSSLFSVKQKKVHLHFEELTESYFFRRSPFLVDVSNKTPELDKNLESFGDSMRKFTQFTALRPLATIDYAGDRFPPTSSSSNIASSIEFDKDGEFFAVAGLTKKIRIFDYSNVIRDVVDIHYPCSEMVCDSKISCVSWGTYLKNKLVSSDYDGDVTLWDAFTTQKLHVYKEHQKRCWSVDFNKMDTKLLASGSDDACVKLWHLDSERALTSLEVKANVCCVQFNPDSRFHLAFGCADHCVHYYDLRNMKEPLILFQGHKKAVSYVKFISGDEIVSASTDSQLKVWNVNQPTCVQSLTGHVNEKHFVGLATDGEFVACGSENNSLYVYYKGLPKKLMSFRFDQRKFALENSSEHREEDTSDFVSAVCWRRGSNVLVTGNSQGIIKIIQMV